jgi:predicted secreted protein
MEKIELTKADHHKIVDAIKGQEIIISLSENPTTGYLWNYANQNERVQLLNSDYEPTSVAMGGGGKRRFHFKVTEAGEIDIVLKLRRSWEKNDGIDDFRIRLLAK